VRRVVKTVIVSFDRLFGEGLSSLLSRTPYDVAAVVTAKSDMLEFRDHAVDLVLLKAPSPAAELADLATAARDAFKDSAIVVLTSHADRVDITQASGLGACAFLPSSTNAAALLQNLDLIMGEATHPLPTNTGRLPHVAAGPIWAEPDDGERERAETPQCRKLSPRETEILESIVRGDSNKHIGRRFRIAETTVKAHVKSIFRKIGVSNRTQAALWAVKRRAGAVPQLGPPESVSVAHTPLRPRAGAVA
jgi:two-component system nitrate/nitrite response regulator NarL